MLSRCPSSAVNFFSWPRSAPREVWIGRAGEAGTAWQKSPRLSVSLFIFLHLSLCLSLPLALLATLWLSLALALSRCVSVSLCVSVCLCLCLFLCFSVCFNTDCLQPPSPGKPPRSPPLWDVLARVASRKLRPPEVVMLLSYSLACRPKLDVLARRGSGRAPSTLRRYCGE